MVNLKTLENAAKGHQVPLDSFLDALKYNKQGLVPAIAQDAATGEVLMLAWMDREAIETTLEEGQVTYFSRSRNGYWRKGETSGNTQSLQSMHIDCDGDSILMKVVQTGAACHTERRSCFYYEIVGSTVEVSANPIA